MVKILVCLAMLVATPVMAQDYYAPMRNNMQRITEQGQEQLREQQEQYNQQQQLQQLRELNQNIQNSNSGN